MTLSPAPPLCSPEVAAEFAAEETEHVEALEDWLARTPRPSATFAADPERPGSR